MFNLIFLNFYKKYNYDTYELIENYSADGEIFVIPKLQEKAGEQSQLKKF